MSVTKKTCFHPYTKATVNQVERWLSAMAERGWTLCELLRWQFVFRKSAPACKEFFLFWSVDARRRGYAFTDYFHAEQQYRKPGSKIVSKSISVFEAAPAKMDATYARAKDARNAYFQHFHVQLLIAALLLAAAEFLLYFVLEAVDTAMFVFLTSVFLAAALLSCERSYAAKRTQSV